MLYTTGLLVDKVRPELAGLGGSMPAADRGMICMGALGCMKPAELMSVGPCVASILMGTA
jgi:hypothetical protein